MSLMAMRPQDPCLILEEAEEVEKYLSALGLNTATVRRAVWQGLSEARMATANSPQNAFGARFYEGAIRTLRELLAPTWSVARPGGLETARRADGELQLTVGMGDAGVCDRRANPTCQHPRGASTEHAVAANQLTLGELAPGADLFLDERQTWWVLYRLDPNERGVVRIEVSLPRDMSAARFVSWKVRTFLPAIRPDSDEVLVRGDIPSEPPEVTFQISRRTG